jgi:hypothetical protein
MRILTFLVIFLLMGVFFIISEKKLNVAAGEDLNILKGEYGKWLTQTAKNSASFLGHVVKMEWLPSSTKDGISYELNESKE